MKFPDCAIVHRCEICNDRADPHEIVTRGAGGKRVDWNVIYLCLAHHGEFHDRGRTTWAGLYPQFADKIWEACLRAGRGRHDA